MEFDIAIDGGGGFYSIRGVSESGKAWIAENVQDGDNGSSYCDDAGRSQEIADGAIEDGLNVGINGLEYVGGGKCAPAVHA